MEQALPYLFGIITTLAIVLGGLLAYRLKGNLKYLIAFCGGTLVATAFLEILPEAIELASEENLQFIFLFMLLSFFTFLFLDKLFFTHGHSHKDDKVSHEESEADESKFRSLYSSGILLHSFIDGLIIGTGFLVNNSSGLLLALIVLLHDFTDGISTTTVMLRHKQKTKSILLLLITSGVLAIGGIIISQLFSFSETNMAYILSLFAGLFLYMGASDLLPEAHKDRSSLKLIMTTMAGAVVIFALTSIL